MLEVPADRVDANQFAVFVERGKALIADGDLDGGRRELDAALRLWSGRALEDLKFEQAIVVHAALLEEQRVAALEERARVDIELGRHAEVVGELQQLVIEHPERERLSGLLMLALYRAGRQGEALAVYDSMRRYLAASSGSRPAWS